MEKEEKEIAVTWGNDALRTIESTYDYIAQEAPLTAYKFALELVNFGNTLGNFPLRHALCVKKILAKRGFRCVTFKNHTFVYRLEGIHLRIHKVFHASQHPRKLRVNE